MKHNRKKSVPAKDLTDAQLLELGKSLQNFYELGYVSKRQSLSFSFLKGVLGGAGAFVGGTLVIALLLWALSLFDQLPFVGQIFESIRHTLQSHP